MDEDALSVCKSAKGEMSTAKELIVDAARQEVTEVSADVCKDAKLEMATERESALIAARQEMNEDAFAVCQSAKEEMKAEKDSIVEATRQEVTEVFADVCKDAKVEMATEKETVLIAARHEMGENAFAVCQSAKVEMTAEKDSIVEEMKRQVSCADDEIYLKTKTDFRKDLTKFYRKKCFVQVSPINGEIFEELASFYVHPKLTFRRKIIHKDTDPEKCVTSYMEVFYKGENKMQNVYIIGEAGMGKSTFCTRLISTWCEGQRLSSEQIKQLYLKSGDAFTDASVVLNFDFLFLVMLRMQTDCGTDVASLIDKQICQHVSHQKTKYSVDFLCKLLDDENCLVIIDGLDEWPHSIPERPDRPNCTYLTTSRPWKMADIKLRNYEIDIEFRIDGIKHSEPLIKKVFTCLCDRSSITNEQKIRLINGFNGEIRKCNLKHFLTVPVVIMLLICLWFETKRLGKSKCEIYARTVEMLLGRAVKDKSKTIPPPDSHGQFKLPRCFNTDKTPYCMQYQLFIERLSALAFHTLLSKTQNKSIVFDSCTVTEHLSDSERKIALIIGILCQHIEDSLVEQRTSFSFPHKTYQEFLCAVYIATKSEREDTSACLDAVFGVFGSVTNVLDISELFVFVCGMQPRIGRQLSEHVAKLLKPPVQTDVCPILESNNGHLFQKIVLAGYGECLKNDYKDEFMPLVHVARGGSFNPHSATEDENLSHLIDINAGALRTLQMRYMRLSDVYEIISKNKSLSSIELNSIGEQGQPYGRINLEAFHSLEHLCMSLVFLTRIDLNADSLISCKLHVVSKEIEQCILLSISKGAPNLHSLSIGKCECPELLLDVLPAMINLHKLYLTNTSIEDRGLCLPSTIEHVELHSVHMSSRTGCRLLRSLSQMDHEVTCKTTWEVSDGATYTLIANSLTDDESCTIMHESKNSLAFKFNTDTTK